MVQRLMRALDAAGLDAGRYRLDPVPLAGKHEPPYSRSETASVDPRAPLYIRHQCNCTLALTSVPWR
ncbi:MAG: hypothetical protein ACLPTZ_16100 [Beijerinckiaceae bacterium]